MTIGTGYAYLGRTSNEALVGVMSDSRLSWRNGRYAEVAVKAHDLGSRVAVVSAGTALVGPFAAELTRSIIDTTIARGERPITLWDATRTFAYFSREIQHDYRDGAQQLTDAVVNEFALVGFYQDGTPGVAQLRLSDGVEIAEFWRPARQELAFVNVGDSTVSGIVTEAYMQAEPDLKARFSDWHDSVASAFWYAICADGKPFASVGGGIAVGICAAKHERFVWPLVEVGGHRFFRGMPMRTPSLPVDQSRSILRLDADVDYAAQLDRAVEDAKHQGGRAPTPPVFSSNIDELIGESPFRRVPEPPSLQGGLR